MKFYNPFKPHIVEDGFGKFWIRVLGVIDWEYYYRPTGDFYCSKGNVIHFNTLELAREALVEAVDNNARQKQRKKLLSVKDRVVK